MQPKWTRSVFFFLFKQRGGSVNSLSPNFTFFRCCCSPLMNTGRRSWTPVRLPAFHLSGWTIKTSMLTCWEMYYCILRQFHLYSVCKASMLFLFQRAAAADWRYVSIHLFQCTYWVRALKKSGWKFKGKKTKAKIVFSLGWGGKSWHIGRTENGTQTHGNIFQVYLDVVVSASTFSCVDKAFKSCCHSQLQV